MLPHQFQRPLRRLARNLGVLAAGASDSMQIAAEFLETAYRPPPAALATRRVENGAIGAHDGPFGTALWAIPRSSPPSSHTLHYLRHKLIPVLDERPALVGDH